MQRPSDAKRCDADWMELALKQARAATEHGDVPVGAVLVGPDGELLGTGRNRREERSDPTAHAELEALRSATTQPGWRREGTTLYVTLEPCAMCMGALVLARVERLVFGAVDPKAGAAVSLYALGSDKRLNHQVLVEGGLLSEAASKLLRAFFRELRGAHRQAKSRSGER